DALVMVRRLAERGVRTEAQAHPDLERVRNLDTWAEGEPLVARANDGAPGLSPAPVRAPKAASPPAPASAPPEPPPATTKLEAATAASRRTSRGSIPIGNAGLSEDVLRFSTDRFTPAGLAYDAVSRRFVVGDQRGRKLRVVGEGQDHAVDLVRSESAGFYDIRALSIDTRRGDLWGGTS